MADLTLLDDYARPVDYDKDTGPRAVAVFLKLPTIAAEDEDVAEDDD